MMKLLPNEIPEWVDPRKCNINNYSNDTPIGHFIEVDHDYPNELHDLHKYYPLTKEKKVRQKMLSKYQLQIEDNN